MGRKGTSKEGRDGSREGRGGLREGREGPRDGREGPTGGRGGPREKGRKSTPWVHVNWCLLDF